jgi:LmbE family N-acetylglucosaminyl deacetylase
VARETYGGNLLAPEEAVTAAAALRTYTTYAAYADFADARTGTIEPGKLADLIVCDRDPLELPIAELKNFSPVATILGGRVVSDNLRACLRRGVAHDSVRCGDPTLRISLGCCFQSKHRQAQIVCHPEQGMVNNVKMTGGILGVYAHPDDEQLATGAFALCTRRGIPVTLICATRGDAGEISDPALATRATLGAVRTRELQEAAKVVGMEPPILWDYPDGYLGDADPRELRDRILETIRALEPRVVTTFDPKGGYGHLDHIAIHKATVAAVAAAGNPNHRPDLGPAHQIDKFYYSVFPRSRLVRFNAARAESGLDPIEFGSVQTVPSDEIGVPDSQITTIVDARSVYELRTASQRAHRTQFGPDSAIAQIPEAVVRALWGSDCFVRVQPPPAANATFPDEHDLWACLPLPVERLHDDATGWNPDLR